MKTATLFLKQTGIWYLLALLLAMPTALHAQGPAWQWVKPVNVYAGPNAPAPNGDVYMAGATDMYATFSPLPQLTNGTGRYDDKTGFIARINSSTQQWLWRLLFQGRVFQITNTADGGVTVVGAFLNTISLGSFTLQSSGNHSLFVAHCSSTGQWQWATRALAYGSFDTSSGDYANMVADITPDGSVAVAGVFTGTVIFGNQAPLTTLANKKAYFVARLNGQTGQWLWAAQATISSGNSGATSWNNVVSDVALTPTGDAVIIGRLSGVGNFGSLPAVSSTSTASANLVVARIGGTTGQWQWAVQATHVGAGYGNTLAVTHTGDVVVAGSISGPVTFGLLPALPGTGGNMVVAGLNGTTGQWQWATQTGGADIFPYALAITSTDDIILAGVVSNTLQISGLPTESFLGDGCFVAKMAAQGGSWQWQAVAKPSLPSMGFYLNGAVARHLSLTATDEPLVSGSISERVVFGSIPVISSNIPNGIADYPSGAFIAKLAAAPLATVSPTLSAQAQLYPNPATSRFTLRLPAASVGPATVVLLNSLGQTVRQQALPTRTQTIEMDVRGLAPGLYTILVPSGTETISRRVAVE